MSYFLIYYLLCVVFGIGYFKISFDTKDEIESFFIILFFAPFAMPIVIIAFIIGLFKK